MSQEFRNKYKYANKDKYYQHYNQSKRYEEDDLERLLILNIHLQELGCWLTNKRYAMIDGVNLYQKYAQGEGEIVRHTCGDGRCINQLHLIRGTDMENAEDEIEVRKFTISYLEKSLGVDYSNIEDQQIALNVLLAKGSRVIPEAKHSLYTLKYMIREDYRVFKETEKAKECRSSKFYSAIMSHLTLLLDEIVGNHRLKVPMRRKLNG